MIEITKQNKARNNQDKGPSHQWNHIWVTDLRQQEILTPDRLEFDSKWLDSLYMLTCPYDEK